MPESLPMKTRLLLAGASLQLISLAKKSEKKEKKQKVVAVSAGMTLSKARLIYSTGQIISSADCRHRCTAVEI